MGYMMNHTIVIECSFGDHLQKAHAATCEIFPWVSPISPPAMNGSQAFFIPPDGSKEGWSDSDTGDERRTRFIDYLRGTLYGDGSSPCNWVEVRMSDDNHKLKIERSYLDEYDDLKWGKR